MKSAPTPQNPYPTPPAARELTTNIAQVLLDPSFILFPTAVRIAARRLHIAESVFERLIAIIALPRRAVAAVSEVSDFVAVVGHPGGGEEECGDGEEGGELSLHP
jgi:hypothetical protein